LIKQTRAKAAHVLLVDAGDALVEPLKPSERDGKKGIGLLNLMKYDAMALGEGDLSRLGVDAIRERMEEADFPVLSANVVIAGTDDFLAQPYVKLEMAGRRIAIIGLTGRTSVSGVEVQDPLEAVKRVVEELRGQADILILLSHTGVTLNRQIASEVPELDLIISGGAEAITPAPALIGGTAVVHADVSSSGHAGRRVGVGTWSFDVQGRLAEQSWQDVSLGESYSDDPEMLAWLRDYE
jgi:5'-nucleotidase